MSKIMLTIKGENSNGKIAVNAEISNDMFTRIMRLLLVEDTAKAARVGSTEQPGGGGPRS